MEYKEDEYIDLSKYFKRLKEGWKTVVLWTIAAFVLGCMFALLTPRKYTVKTELAPELSSTATNRLSSMASLVGLSSTLLGTTDAVYPMVYPELLKSPEFQADLFKTPVTVYVKGEAVDTDLYDYLLNHQKSSLMGVIMGAPAKVLSWVKGLFSDKREETAGDGVDPFRFTKEQGMVARVLSKSITASIDKKTMILTVSTTMQDPVICALVAKAVNQNLKDYVTLYRTEKAVKDCEYYEKLNVEAKEEYLAAQRAYSRYVDTHQGVSLQSYLVESDRLKNEANLKFQLYNSTSQQYQNAKAKVQMETPVFAEVVPPTVPLKSSNSRKKTALAFALLGMIAGAAYVLFKNREED